MRPQRFFPLIILLFVVVLAVVPAAGQDASTEEPIPDDAEPAWDGTLRRIRVPILMYHYVSPLPPNADQFRVELTISPEAFRAHAEYLFFEGYSTISFYQLNEALLNGLPLPPKPIILTFDDGYIDHYTNVLPTLQERGFTATFFIITGLVDAADPAYLSWEQIQEMAAAGMDIEPHTKNHLSLREREYDFLVYEMLGSIESLRAYLGRTPHILAYPVGQFDEETLTVARQLPIWRAVTTQPGRYHTTDNRLELDRVRITGGMSAAGLASLLNSE